MKALLRVLFVCGFVFLSVHLVRLAYQMWLEPTSSVLDKYDDEVEAGIKSAASIDELLEQYDKALQEIEEYEKDPANEPVPSQERYYTAPYDAKNQLEEAIKDWELKSHQIYKVRIYWVLGLLFLVLGIAAYKRVSEWLGVSALLVAFSEMIFWTSPSYFSGRSLEFERLLANKLSLAVVTYALLLATAYTVGVISRKESA